MDCFQYPFDCDFIMKNKRKIKRELLEKKGLIEKKVAILGGSTTSEIKNILELFLLNNGIKPLFYECEYNKYYETVMFLDNDLFNFKPDIIYFHTNYKNISQFPSLTFSKNDVDDLFEKTISRFYNLWETASKKFNCIIIQNNFDFPFYRVLGNMDTSDYHGRINFLTKLNMKFYEYANEHNNFYINDINYLSSWYGLEKWSESSYWYMYKYALNVNAIPYLASNLANIIKAIYGKNKKALVLDLDNTLWGGVIGDDGQEGISIGQENSVSQAYYDFQSYIKELKNNGVILNINSKNDYDNALLGLDHPDSVLKQEDFVMIKANWEPKSSNMRNIADSLALGLDSFVFIDDNPAERQIVNLNLPTVATPCLDCVENYINMIDKQGYFECVSYSSEDLEKTKLYQSNLDRQQLLSESDNYDDYLKSLKMEAYIGAFDDISIPRITQLTNKSNQFNLTTRRYTEQEIKSISLNKDYITLYGRLKDTFGDNGIVSVIIGNKKDNELHIDLWLMSCRVLKRNLEHLMLDMLVEKCKEYEITEIVGYYLPTSKNGMVSNFYGDMGFVKVSENDNNTIWKLDILNYKEKNEWIKVLNNE